MINLWASCGLCHPMLNPVWLLQLNNHMFSRCTQSYKSHICFNRIFLHTVDGCEILHHLGWLRYQLVIRILLAHPQYFCLVSWNGRPPALWCGRSWPQQRWQRCRWPGGEATRRKSLENHWMMLDAFLDWGIWAYGYVREWYTIGFFPVEMKERCF